MGLEGKKTPKKSHFFEGFLQAPTKKIENEMLIFLLFLAYYKLSEVFKNINFFSKIKTVSPKMDAQSLI